MTRRENACVADQQQEPVSALHGVALPGRHGARSGPAGVTACEVAGLPQAIVFGRQGRTPDLIAAARAAFGVELPLTPRRVVGAEVAFAWSGPGQWLATSHSIPGARIESVLENALRASASVVDQSHGRAVLRVSGPRVRDALAKGVAIDLDPSRFGVGSTAVTVVAHVGVHLWQIDATPTFELSVPRSLAESFWHWLEVSSAEYGLDVTQGQ
jgi:methylglutamate dehydrogenase subunit D